MALLWQFNIQFLINNKLLLKINIFLFRKIDNFYYTILKLFLLFNSIYSKKKKKEKKIKTIVK